MTTSALSPDPRYPTLQWQPGSFFQGDHVVYFYQESDSLLETLSAYIGRTLGANNDAIVIATNMNSKKLNKQLIKNKNNKKKHKQK